MVWLELPVGAKSAVLLALPYPLLIKFALGGGTSCRGREDMVMGGMMLVRCSAGFVAISGSVVA